MFSGKYWEKCLKIKYFLLCKLIFRAVRAQSCLKWICISCGIIGLLLSGALFAMRQEQTVQVTKPTQNGAAT